MIIFVIYRIGIFADETEGDTPVAAHFHRPIPLAISAQFMKIQTGEIHILRTGGCLKPRQDKTQPFSMLWLNTSLAALCEETLQALVLESYDHDAL